VVIEFGKDKSYKIKILKVIKDILKKI
jgi:hypothetical protein